ncbi:helix-turn-helix transcriptional regulator [Tumebacillus sp. ITR2]|uniref:Helix-turn-helix transcriptional regulator n=1 Tax=Tumebacillus amylolyticus TaxID=2801339 RepID=A0ABS1JAH2_9BACL|nr:helix-turn-helix transcriptional regulator [Tumebacillus amylolyticus]MBL0387280.1 helix-turn-helix transcriptional regulator [Tumebacillus amylolyticus]
MSTVEHILDTDLNRIPLVRRILELMNEKGDAFTIRGFASRLGISREYLRLMTTGERPISPAMLERIAHGLGVTVERLKQKDTVKQEQDLQVLLNGKRRTKTTLARANKLATELMGVAFGATERAYSLNNLGRVQYLQMNYEEAHRTWLRALDYAKTLQTDYGDSHLLHLVTANLMITHIIRKEYTGIEDMLSLVEGVFADHPEALGLAQSARMKMQEERGNLDLAKAHAYRALEFFQKTDNEKQIGTALINVAYIEYLLGNYDKSSEVLRSAIDGIREYDDILIHVVKDYVKALMKKRDYQKVVEIVKEYETLAKDFPDFSGRLKIMYSVAADEPSIAESVANNKDMSYQVRHWACKCLMEYYYLKGDADSAIRYYEKVRIYSNTKSEFLDEEGF